VSKLDTRLGFGETGFVPKGQAVNDITSLTLHLLSWR
jgi:hypothetical protein